MLMPHLHTKLIGAGAGFEPDIPLLDTHTGDAERPLSVEVPVGLYRVGKYTIRCLDFYPLFALKFSAPEPE